jgi:hypothetical protein
VNKSQKRESCDQDIKIREDIDSISGLSLRNSVCVANISVKKENNIIEKVSIIKAKDKKTVNIVTNYKGNKKVINNNKKMFSTFNNNKNKDYKKSNKDKNMINKNKGGLSISKVNNNNNKEGLSKVNINKSNNKDYTKAGDNSRKVSVIRDNKNISEKESC